MNQYTIDILSEYPNDITNLDISNKNINGLLELDKFKYLKKIDFSNNNITIFKINANTIIEFLNWDFNPLIELEYPVLYEPDNLSTTLEKLHLGNYFNKPIDNLHNGLTYLSLGY